MSQTTATRIDSHAHIVPPALIDEARKSGASLGCFRSSQSQFKPLRR